jgi:hypothetical protein
MDRKTMRLAIGTAMLVFVVGLPVYCQEPDREKQKPTQQEERKREPDRKQDADKPRPQEPRQQEPKQQERDRREPDRAQQRQDAERARQAEPQQTEKQQKDAAKQQQQPEKDRAKQDKAARERVQQIQRDQRNNGQQAQRDGGNRNVRRIRDEDFRAHFGREHHFHVERRDDRRFHYGGYWFEFAEPWPADWSYDDDVYVDDIDGDYYLIDRYHPGFHILVVVVE